MEGNNNIYPTILSKQLWERYIKNYDFSLKLECSLFDQKWLALCPSGQKLFWFKKYPSSLSQYKNLKPIVNEYTNI